jgi:hypothetical protein
MSNVIIGIIGVILFVGLALAGATYFGPRVTQSTSQAQAGRVMSELVEISNAVKVRDQERQMATSAGFDVDFLAPDYVSDAPSNPTDGPDPFLLDSNGDATGVAAIAAMKISGSRMVVICNEISKLGGGPSTAPVRLSANRELAIGCFRIDRNLSAQIRKDDYIAFAVI